MIGYCLSSAPVASLFFACPGIEQLSSTRMRSSSLHPPPTPFLLWIVACGQSGLVGSIPASLAALQIVRDIPNSAEDAFVFYTLLADTPEVW
jgi:hypothetical protein